MNAVVLCRWALTSASMEAVPTQVMLLVITYLPVIQSSHGVKIFRDDLEALGLSCSWYRKAQRRPGWRSAIESRLQCP